MRPRPLVAWGGAAVLAGVTAIVLFGGGPEPPDYRWVWGGNDGGAPTTDAEARDVYDRPDDRRLLEFEARGDAPLAEGEPMGVSLRGTPGLRDRLLAAV